jgi:hypothetical protein
MRAIIKLAYKQIIDASSTGEFEKLVFNDSYQEFQMQVQAYNPESKFKTLKEVIAASPKANSLHYKVGFAVGLYIRALNNQIPGLTDSLGQANVPFTINKFEIIESDISNKAIHKVAITYITDTLTLIDVIGEYLLLTVGDQFKNDSNEPVETLLLKMRDGLSISSYSEQRVPATF